MASISLLLAAAVACHGLSAPVTGPVLRFFEPRGAYAGHWGVDLAAVYGTRVSAAGSGRVVFAGPIAGRLSVTIDHGGGLLTSYSYLSQVWAASGSSVGVGTALGASGFDHGLEALHFSVRVHGVYQDPLDWMTCLADLSRALALLSRTG